jgi:hypothetical protein
MCRHCNFYELKRWFIIFLFCLLNGIISIEGV